MVRYFLVLTGFLVLLGSRPAAAQQSEATKLALSQIRETLNDYIIGRVAQDSERLRRVLQPDAQLLASTGSALQATSVPTLLTELPASRPHRRAGTITYIDTQDHAAIARIDYNHGRYRGVDFVQLLRVNDQWRIVGTVHDEQPR